LAEREEHEAEKEHVEFFKKKVAKEE